MIAPIMITGLHLLQRYPQIRMLSTRKDMFVRSGKLFIGCKPSKKFNWHLRYFKIGHDVAHFIEAPKNRMFVYNVGLPTIEHPTMWATRGKVRKRMRAGALRELRVDIIHYNLEVAFPSRRDTRQEWINVRCKQLYRRFKPGFYGMTKEQALRYLHKKAEGYVKKYTKRFVYNELERRLDLLVA